MGLADRDYMYERKPHARPLHFGSRRSGLAVRVFFWITVFALAFLAFRWLDERRWVVPFPETGQTHWFVRVGGVPTAPLTITAPARGSNYVVRLDDWISGTVLALIPVRAGETSRTPIPLGRYRVTIAKGTRWLGPERMFGRDAEVREAVHPIHLFRAGNRTTGQHIRLDASMSGNMPMRPMNVF